ncbi:restriction endonuclease subunit S [Roseivirga pacifica]|uniref:restriction endonuclease subunit S n=1 Tax=Roseivirga pacifica TaxID=1267423 RepID=UPI003BB18B03
MRSNYKPIGDFIELVDERNKKLEIDLLLGLSISKEFIPSVANTVGANMANYKIIRRGQFACSIMQVRRDKKMPVALLRDFDEAIISQAYPVFKIKDENVLLPEYLMMWFSRSEFDRHACFLAVGGVRGSLEWEDFLEMELPVPSIEKQRAIVKEYNTVVNRIKLNEQLNQKLEETAQALYKHWFVDFEFPNEEGNPYKSSDGKMVYNEGLEKEIPVGWKFNTLESISSVKAGGDRPKEFSEFKTGEFQIPIYSNSTDNEGLYGFTTKAKTTEKSITVSARGAIIGYTVLRLSPFVPIVRLIVVTPLTSQLTNYLFETIKSFKYDESGSAQGQLTAPEICLKKVINPECNVLKRFQDLTDKIYGRISLNKAANESLERLVSLILSKMTQVEEERVLTN